MKIPSLVTVRVASSRLDGKCLLQFGKDTVLHFVIKRALKAGLDPILCTTKNSEDDIIEKIGKDLKVKTFRGNVNNKLLRWKDCCEYYNLKKFHTIDADDPFFCIEGVKKSFNLLEEGFDVICPTKSSSNGTAAMGYSLSLNLVERAVATTSQDEDTEMMWGIIENLDDVKKLILPEYEEMGSDVRLTLDYWEDYVMLSCIKALLKGHCDRKNIANLLREFPKLKKINWFRNLEWANKQTNKLDKFKNKKV
jgi:spore coat polysaccharide biosynthesis protein SpsF (cytidylyltransferase family)